jgi:hypothetical protein
MAKKPRPSDVSRLSIASDFAVGSIIDALRPRPAKEFRVTVRRPDDLANQKDFDATQPGAAQVQEEILLKNAGRQSGSRYQ